MRTATWIIVPVFWFLCTLALGAPSLTRVEYLRCEYRVDPLGIDVVQPRLYWEMHDSRRGARQTAYQILVASSPEKLAAGIGDLWDGGKVVSDQSIQVVYAGKPLKSRMRCCWKVRIWDQDGKPSAYSKPAIWTMGLLNPKDVTAGWIGLSVPMVYPNKRSKITFDGCPWIWIAEDGIDPRVSAPKGSRFFRGSLTVSPDREIVRARFLITADDAFELFVNGKLAGQGSAWNQPLVADITNHLSKGLNCMAIAVTNGARSPAGLVGKLLIELDNGETITQRIDKSWKASDRSLPNWNTPAGDDADWPTAVEIAKMGDAPWGKLEAVGADVLACPCFRKIFDCNQPVRRATIYASALGLYRLNINGKRVGNDFFSPGWTDYNRRVYYSTYDATDLVRSQGDNVLDATLAAGWYAGAIGWKSERFIYGTDPRLFVQLEIEFEDGTTRTVVTDRTWKAAFGPIMEGEFLAGETYDARKALHKMNEPGFNSESWLPVSHVNSIRADLQANPNVPVRETGTVKPVNITQPKPGRYVFDLGQNFAGFVRLKVKGPAGTRVVMRFAEMLNPDGTLYTANLRGARCTDTYILRGGDEETWQPQFTFHGFRYVEMTGYPGTPTLDTLTGIALNSDTPLVGSFECSSPLVNQLYSNIVWTQRANFISVPTDCPQRDERLGWTGDAEVFIRAATYNADVGAFFTKWLVDLEDAQGPTGDFPDVAPRVVATGGGTAAWADAGTICPWTIYQVYNDRRVIEKHYESMVRWIEYCRHNSEGLLRPNAGYGDWLSIKAETPKDVLATAFFAHSTQLTAQAAQLLGKQDDAKKYGALFQQIKAAFNKAYVSPDGRIKGNTQTCYVLGLWFDLLPENKRAVAARYLVEDIKARGTHLSTGFIGTSSLMPTLTATGNTAVAYELLLNDTFPSWGYSIKQGATSIWERWDGWTAEKGFQDPGMNSFAHYSFGAVARWMFQTVAGMDTDGPGFKQLRICPQLGEGLTWVNASYHSIHGRITSAWKTEDGQFTLELTVPANTTATVYIPADSVEKITEGGHTTKEAEGVEFLRSEPGVQVFHVDAGKYRFTTD